jgi:hypothetical protein
MTKASIPSRGEGSSPVHWLPLPGGFFYLVAIKRKTDIKPDIFCSFAPSAQDH